MGFALAQVAAERGAVVHLIAGPVVLESPIGVKREDVTSANEMFEAVKGAFNDADVVIMAAAVADYRVQSPSKEKIKKKATTMDLQLEKNDDILFYLGNNKQNQLLVGFALETENEIANAEKKLISKKLDAIVLNSLKNKGAGFATDTNQITILQKDNKLISFELKHKNEVAADILDVIENLL